MKISLKTFLGSRDVDGKMALTVGKSISGYELTISNM
jgi:hypothetical protein